MNSHVMLLRGEFVTLQSLPLCVEVLLVKAATELITAFLKGFACLPEF